MSLTKKVVTTYAKSLFQNVNMEKGSGKVFDISKLNTNDNLDNL